MKKKFRSAAAFLAVFFFFLYFHGNAVKQDFAKAAELLKRSAESGFLPAQEFLGYENGKMPSLGMSLEEALRRHFLQTQQQ